MNKIFKVIWNYATQSWVAVSELNKTKGKTKSLSLGSNVVRQSSPMLKFSLISSGLLLASGQVMAVTGADHQISNSANQCYYDTASKNVVCGDATTNATGSSSVVIGTNSQSVTLGSVVIGNGAKDLSTTYTKRENIVIGSNATIDTAGGSGNIVMGMNTKLNGGSFSVVSGASNNVTGSMQNVIGYGNMVHGGSRAQAFGDGNRINIADNQTSVIAIGQGNKIFNSSASHALGRNNVLGSTNHRLRAGLALGGNNFVFGDGSTSISSNGNGQANNFTRFHASIIGGVNSYSIGTGNIIGTSSTGSMLLGNSIRVGASDALVTTADDGNHTVSYENLTTAEYAVALGNNITVNNGSNAIAMGRNTNVNGTASIAQGFNTNVNGTSSISMGRDSNVTGNYSIGMGYQSVVNGNDAVAIGRGSNATNAQTIAIGRNAVSNAVNATVIGTNANVRSNTSGESIAIGTNASISGDGQGFAIAMGHSAKTEGINSMALGRSSSTAGQSSIAVGTFANASSSYAIASGMRAMASAENSIAIGHSANATHDHAVALGSNSVSAAANPTSQTTLNRLTYGSFAGATPTSTVSVGASGSERQIVNVAAGRISNTSTDAINGSQLYATNLVLGNLAASLETILGGNAKLLPNGTISMTNVGNTTQNNIHDAINNIRTQITNNAEEPQTYFHVNNGTNAGTGNATTNLGKVGEAAGALSLNSITAGVGAKVENIGRSSIAIGTDAMVNSNKSIALGNNAKVNQGDGSSSIAIGDGAKVEGSGGGNSIAIGKDASVDGGQSLAIGDSSIAIGRSTAIGSGSNASGVGSTALGIDVKASGDSSLAIGQNANAEGVMSTAVGPNTYVSGTYSLALGNGARAEHDLSVALGAGSMTDEPPATKDITNATINGITYGNFAGNVSTAVVSVGEKNKDNDEWSIYRNITNVAAGRITADSTDAINGSQLYMVAYELSEEISKATSNITNINNLANNTIKLGGDNGTTTSAQSLNQKNGLQFNVNGGDGISTTANGSSITVTAKTDGTTIKIDASGNITANTGTITPAPNTTDAVGNILPNAGKVSVIGTPADNETQEQANIREGNKLATVGDVANAINSVGWVVNTGKAADPNSFDTKTVKHQPAKISAGSKVNFQAGKNMEVKRDGENIIYATSDNVSFNTVTVGNTNITSNGVTINNGPSMTTDGINAGNKVISNVAPGVRDSDAVNVSQLKGAVNNINSQLNKMDKRRKAGHASGLAVAGLMQAYREGQSAVTAGVGQYQNQSAVAVGYSRIADSGKYGVKAAFTANTQGEVGGTLSAGYFW